MGEAGEGRREGHRNLRKGEEEINRDGEEAFPPSQIRFPADPSLPRAQGDQAQKREVFLSADGGLQRQCGHACPSD